MTKHKDATNHDCKTGPESIRDELERQAWIQNPKTSLRLSNRRMNENRQNPGWFESARRIKSWQDRTLLTLIAILLVLFVIRTETAIADEQVWGLQMKSDSGAYTELAVNTNIQLDITGLLARVEITQQFSNRGSHWAEGVYRFPLPDGAAVDHMRIQVGDRLLVGEIQEKQTARQTYQRARDAGRTTTIVEQQRRNQFETRLANIGPGENVEITISYLQNISYSEYSYNLRVPMTFTPRWEPGRVTTGTGAQAPVPKLIPAIASTGHKLSLQALIVSAAEFTAIESRYHDVDIRQTDNGYTIELLNPDETSDRDFELSWTPALQSQPSASLSSFNDGESVYVQLMLVPPLADSIGPQPREVILIIDTSGSMEGASMVQAKAALKHALNSLGSEDYFNLLQFNSNTQQLFDESVPVNNSNLYIARNFITGLHANGGTEMAPALQSALTLPELSGLMRQVIFITDGAVGNENDLLQKVAQDLGDSRMFTVAIGHAPNSWFMRKAAEIGRGSYVHIGKPNEVAEQMSALWGRIQLPALTDICIDWGDSAEYYPAVIPDLYAGEPLWLLARLPGEPTLIDLCGQFNGADWNLTVNGWDAASGDTGEDNLAKLWARKKVESLEDSLMFGADPELTRLEITSLALDFDLLTQHTSLVAVDKTPRRQSTEALATSNIPGLLPGSATAQVAGYPNTATGWLAQLLLSILVLLVATSMLLFSSSHLPMRKHPKTRLEPLPGSS